MPTFVRLTDYKNSEEKEKGFFEEKNRFIANQEDFFKIPGSPIAYWVSDRVREIFEKSEKLGEIVEIITGMTIGNNDKYLRLWYEVSFYKINLYKTKMSEINLNEMPYIPYNKGGESRKWYGNNEYVVNWSYSHNFNRAKTTLKHLYLKEGLTWNFLTSGMFSMRYFPKGFLWDVAGSPCFVSKNKIYYILGFLLTKIATNFLNLINPTLNYQAVELQALPIIFPNSLETKHKIDELTQECINISKEEWDSRETSWDFRINELIRMKSENLPNQPEVKSDVKLEYVYNAYCEY